MKKSLLALIVLLAFAAGGNTLRAQWAQYNADALPGEDATVAIRDAGSTILNGTSEIVADDENQDNSWWKFDVDLDAADVLKYNWYPSYVDPDAADPVYTPAVMTIAVKSKWIDTTGYFGPDVELRGFYKVQAKVVKEDGRFHVRVKDWDLDSTYILPESFDPREWHVLRLTEKNGSWDLYVNEAEIPLASGSCGKSVDKHLAILGAYAENGKSKVIVDWMGLIEDEAAGPAETALPPGIFTPSAVSVKRLEAQMLISIFPNPVSETLTLTVGSEMINAGYTLYSVTGQMVHDGNLTATQEQIDVSSLQPGMYIIKVDGGGSVACKSFVVK